MPSSSELSAPTPGRALSIAGCAEWPPDDDEVVQVKDQPAYGFLLPWRCRTAILIPSEALEVGELGSPNRSTRAACDPSDINRGNSRVILRVYEVHRFASLDQSRCSGVASKSLSVMAGASSQGLTSFRIAGVPPDPRTWPGNPVVTISTAGRSSSSVLEPGTTVQMKTGSLATVPWKFLLRKRGSRVLVRFPLAAGAPSPSAN